MKNTYLVGGLIAIICVAIGIYYFIPGINHVLSFSGAVTDLCWPVTPSVAIRWQSRYESARIRARME